MSSSVDTIPDSHGRDGRGPGAGSGGEASDLPDLQPSHLVAFALVAELGSVSLAARRLHVVQAAVSAQLRRLREAVGDPLCHFEQGHVHLTPAGVELRKHALRVAEGVAAAREFAWRLQRRIEGRLRIALTVTIGSYYLPCPLVAFQDRYPGIRVEIETGSSREIVGRAEAFDLVFVEEPLEGRPPPDYVRKPWIEEEILLVTPRESRLARDFPKGVALGHLQGEKVLWREADSGVRRAVERAFSALRIEPPGHVELPSAQGVIEAARAGLGIGFIATSVLPEEDPGLAALRINPPEGLWWSLAILAPPPAQRSAGAAAFLALLEQIPGRMARGGIPAPKGG